MNSMTNGSADAALPMSKWQITRTVTYTETIIVEAATKTEAYAIARKAPDDDWETDDTDTDYVDCELEE